MSPSPPIAPDADAATPPSPVPLRVTEVAITHDGADAATPVDVTFEVRPGEVVLVLGPSGSGKSTLALALNGLIPQAVPADLTGTITVGGVDTTSEPVARLSTHVAMVFQDPDAQLVTGTVLDEVAFGPENLRIPASIVLERAERALRRVGLWERRDENPDRLSGGGRQRLAIACALAMEAPLLVLDEPTANLDPAGTEEVYAVLAEVVAAGDRSIVLIEHNLDAAIGFIDRVVVMDAAGTVIADGAADAVLRERAAELHEHGVWLPTATIAALRLRSAGYPINPLPLTPAELTRALEHLPEPRDCIRAPKPGADLDTRRALLDHRGGSGAEMQSRGPAAEPIVRVRGLTVERRRARILHGIDLDIEAGEFVAVVGANGAGKTTLVQAIAGVVPPPRGTVRVGELDPARADVANLAAQIGFVFQNPEHQFIAHTVFDELAHGLRLRGAAPAETDAAVTDILRRFGLTGREQAHPFLLSGGQKRRLSVGTALIAGAPVLALDEPTFGQDRARADELLGLLDDLHRSGTTIIVVTHDMQLVAEHATHIAVLGGGRLLAHGPTAAILADERLLEASGLRTPPLARALRELPTHPRLEGITRLADLPEAVAAHSELASEPASGAAQLREEEARG